jgi:hypothetical protein
MQPFNFERGKTVWKISSTGMLNDEWHTKESGGAAFPFPLGETCSAS